MFMLRFGETEKWCVHARTASLGVDLYRRAHRPGEGGDARGGVTLQSSENDDAPVVGLVAVVEDEVIAGRVVAEVADLRIRPFRLTVQRESGAGRGPVFSTPPWSTISVVRGSAATRRR
jgi:hypothetical protein